jgi:hypothetical protein
MLSVRPKQILPNLASQRFSAPDSEWPVGTNGTRCNFFRPKSRPDAANDGRKGRFPLIKGTRSNRLWGQRIGQHAISTT